MTPPRSPITGSNAEETSPLLRKTSHDPSPSYGAQISSATTGAVGDVESEGSSGACDPSSSTAGQDETRNYDGIPEVRKRLKYIMPALAIGVFLSAADQTIIMSSYGKIGSDLKALNSTSWVATAYFLTLTSFQPLYGKLSDIFGRQPALLSAYAIFGVGCALCGLSQTIGQLISARALAGIGGGGMTTVVSILLSDVVALRDRGTFQGYINIVYAAGAALGAPLGGFFVDSIGWQWSFLCQVPLAFIALVSVYFTLDLPPTEDADWRAKLRRIDFLGAFVLVASLFTLLLGLDRGSNITWKSPVTAGLLSASALLFIAFILVETKVATEPFAPGRIIFEKSLLACYLCNFFSLGGWLSTLFYLPLYYQAVDGVSAAQAGARLMPAILAAVTGSLFAGFVMKKTGRYLTLTVVAYMMLLWGFVPILLFTGLVSTSTAGSSIGLAICGFGNGIVARASTADQAVATACSYLFRSLGSVLGLAISATVVQQSLRTHLRAALSNGSEADKIIEHARQSLDYIKTLDPVTRDVVRHCYGAATRAGFFLNACFVAGAALSAFFVGEHRLSR
ncbi:MAG: hypothetical protein M1823_000144 [Watsoniomyces obsoletus]|nr:MAG: hypothetical protein M1823_000144 [Watsoniomyces obsoletus]